MSNAPVDTGRRRFLTWSTVAVGGVGAAFTAVPFIKSWNPSAKAKAAGAPVEVDISKLEPGQLIRVEWRGKPVWVVKRTKQTLDALAAHDDKLRIPHLKSRSSLTMPITGIDRSSPKFLSRSVFAPTWGVHLPICLTALASRCRALRPASLPVSWLQVRHGRPCVPGGACTAEPGHSALSIH